MKEIWREVHQSITHNGKALDAANSQQRINVMYLRGLLCGGLNDWRGLVRWGGKALVMQTQQPKLSPTVCVKRKKWLLRFVLWPFTWTPRHAQIPTHAQLFLFLRLKTLIDFKWKYQMPRWSPYPWVHWCACVHMLGYLKRGLWQWSQKYCLS